MQHPDCRTVNQLNDCWTINHRQVLGDYWRLLEITGDYWRLLETYHTQDLGKVMGYTSASVCTTKWILYL